MERPIYDLIIGNIQDARNPQDLDPEWNEEYCIATEVSERISAEETEEFGRTRNNSAGCD